jgi:crotonobetainyl-CoA:carnitine CoA-transferase CaiB-like acyl-CoA transferase
MAEALRGVTVIDLTQVLAGPHCTRLLADMGANVIKIEEPGGNSYDRKLWGSFGEEGLRRGYAAQNRNKKNITLNLKSVKGKEIFLDLVRKGDVVVQNYSAGVMGRLGFEYNTLKAVNSNIIYCAISGFGQTGPYKSYPAYDSIIQAYCGYLTINGFPYDPPCRIGFSVCDYLGGIYGAYSILVALYYREISGKGQMIDCSLFDIMSQTNIEWLLPTIINGYQSPRKGNDHPMSSPTGIFHTKDKKHIFLTLQAQKQWQRLTEIIGRRDLNALSLDDRLGKYRQEVNASVEKWAKTKDRDEALSILRKAKLPCAPVQNLLDLLSDKHSIARGNFVEMQDDIGLIDKIPGVAPKFSLTPGSAKFGYVKAGKHNEEVYTRLLGYHKTQIEEFAEKGII